MKWIDIRISTAECEQYGTPGIWNWVGYNMVWCTNFGWDINCWHGSVRSGFYVVT